MNEGDVVFQYEEKKCMYEMKFHERKNRYVLYTKACANSSGLL